jgi:hypothetical protein
MSSIGSESALQLKDMYNSSIATRNTVRTVPPDKPIEDGQTIVRPSSPSGTEQRETALAEIDREASENQAAPTLSLLCERVPQETTLPDSTLSTPVRQIGRGFQSPVSEDETTTPHTVLFTPIRNGEVLSPLTEDNRTTASPDKAETTLPERTPLLLSRTGLQQASLYNVTSTQAQEVNEEKLFPAEDLVEGRHLQLRR